MSKRANKERIEQFRRDLAALKKNHQNTEIAQVLGIDPTRVSSYSTGAKNPGEDFINEFYRKFGEEIKKPAADHSNAGNNDQPPLDAEQPPQLYTNRNAQDELIRVLKINNERLGANLDKIVNTIDRDSKTRERDSQGMLILIQTNANLESRLGPRIPPPQETS